MTLARREFSRHPPKGANVNTVQFPYDLVLSGGTVIDPSTGRNGRFDVAIAGGKIAAVEPDLSKAPRAKGSTCPARS